MKRVIYIIATSHVLLPAYANLNKETRCGLYIEEFAEFALTLKDHDRDEIESRIFDTVYFRHRDIPEYRGLFESDELETWRQAYNLLSARIERLYDALLALHPKLTDVVKLHVDLDSLKGKKVLYGVDRGDVMLMVRDIEDDD